MIKRLDTQEERERFEGFMRALLASNSIEQIRRDLSELSVPSPYRLRMKILYSAYDFISVFNDLANQGGVERASQNVPAFSIRRKYGRDPHGEIAANFIVLPSNHVSIRVLVSVSTSEQWRVLRGFIRRQYPRLVPILLSQKELIQGVLALRGSQRTFVLRVKELTAKESLENSSKQAKSVREWTDEQLKDALARIADRRQILTSIKLAFHKSIGHQTDVVPSVLVKVTKNGEVEVTGSFGLAWETVVAHVAEVGNRKLDFYSRRGLRERQYRPAPLEVRFSMPVFADPGEARRLVRLLTRYPHSMHSVEHGNPYVHVQVSDVYDGSAFDIWAVSSQSIVLVPRLKATEAAFERLIHYIFDRFREGEVREYCEG